MAYVRKGNSPKPDGTPSRWAAKLASHAANEIASKRQGNLMLASILGGPERAQLILPETTGDEVDAIVLYGAKLGGDRLRQIIEKHQFGLFDNICEFWRSYCCAFVRFRITPYGVRRLEITDHNATVRSTSEIDDIELQMVPTLQAFDGALDTELAIAHAGWLASLQNAHQMVKAAEAAHVHAE